MNLISNAIKFTDTGAVNVRVNTKLLPKEPDRTLVHICVEDSGIGMNPETQKKVFDPFTQADTSTTRKYGGTGLGLSISRHYIELMGGDIAVKSIENEGTRITISIPMTIAVPFHPAPSTGLGPKNVRILTSSAFAYEMVSSHFGRIGLTCSPIIEEELSSSYLPENELVVIDYSYGLFERLEIGDSISSDPSRCLVLVPLSGDDIHLSAMKFRTIPKPITQSSLVTYLSDSFARQEQHIGDVTVVKANNDPVYPGKRSILIAEDVETNQAIIREIIQLLGHSVEIANNGEIALGKYLSGNFSMIFMDCQMPQMDGYAATTKIREYETQNGSTRIPIIALTAGSDEQDRERCKDAGMDDYVTKPFSIEDIRNSISQHLDLDEDISPVVSQKTPDLMVENAEQASVSILDEATIDGIRDIEKQTGKPLLPLIFEGYIEQMNEKIKQLDTAFQKSEVTQSHQVAHAIKSMSANIGARNVRSLALRIEEQCKNGERFDKKHALNTLTRAYTEFVDAFDEVVLQAIE